MRKRKRSEYEGDTSRRTALQGHRPTFEQEIGLAPGSSSDDHSRLPPIESSSEQYGVPEDSSDPDDRRGGGGGRDPMGGSPQGPQVDDSPEDSGGDDDEYESDNSPGEAPQEPSAGDRPPAPVINPFASVDVCSCGSQYIQSTGMFEDINPDTCEICKLLHEDSGYLPLSKSIVNAAYSDMLANIPEYGIKDSCERFRRAIRKTGYKLIVQNEESRAGGGRRTAGRRRSAFASQPLRAVEFTDRTIIQHAMCCIATEPWSALKNIETDRIVLDILNRHCLMYTTADGRWEISVKSNNALSKILTRRDRLSKVVAQGSRSSSVGSGKTKGSGRPSKRMRITHP